jgi:hypothetical protein
LLVVLLGGAPALFPTPRPPTRDFRGARDAGKAGGPIEIRFPPTLGLGLDMVIDGGLAFEGVPVLGVEVLDVFVDNCFVGDFVGDYLVRIKLTLFETIQDILE